MRQYLCLQPVLAKRESSLEGAGLTKREAPTFIFHVHSMLSSNSLFKYHKPLININSLRLGFRDLLPHKSYSSYVSRMRMSFYHRTYFM